MRIEVCGGIASGKTTLAELCHEAGLEVQYERFQENPFFEKFYADPGGFAFEAELTYLLQHFSQAREAALRSKGIATDFSFALDLAYARVTLQDTDVQVFERLLDRVIEKIALPKLIVRLECPSDVELQRVHQRYRPAEQRIGRPFLDAIDNEIERALSSTRFSAVPVHRVDSQMLDFRPGGRDRHRVLEQVMEATSRGC